eukprot:TRINITY_DN1687_c0_g1_i4.p1 TRINITY_DN1687_c0_g1~~TRINITY_DN1687_c0_g1_i4.p1  ORF type:complete len:380 (+),score=129.78 TRINITY_DN1687_c0_g1_i4:64-1203(+)
METQPLVAKTPTQNSFARMIFNVVSISVMIMYLGCIAGTVACILSGYYMLLMLPIGGLTTFWCCMVAMWINPEVRACAGEAEDKESSEALVASWQNTEAVVVMWIKCYHMRTVAYRNSDGSSGTTQQRVDTHSAIAPVYYDAQVDESPAFTVPNEKTLVSCDVELSFGDSTTLHSVEDQYRRFLEANTQDTHQDRGFGVDLPEFRSSLMVRNKGMRNLYMLSTALGVLPVVHACVSGVVKRGNYSVKKKLLISRESPYAVRPAEVPTVGVPLENSAWALPYVVHSGPVNQQQQQQEQQQQQGQQPQWQQPQQPPMGQPVQQGQQPQWQQQQQLQPMQGQQQQQWQQQQGQQPQWQQPQQPPMGQPVQQQQQQQQLTYGS